MDGGRSNPYVFIVGCPRSGTTLVERMVDAHPDIAIVHETHFIAKFFRKRVGLTRDGFVTPELARRLREHRRFARFRMPGEELDALVTGPPMSYADFITRLYDQYGRQEGKTRVGDKTTGGYLRNIPSLHTLWPQARFVHVVRDGRDVCLSMLTWPKAGRAAGRLPTWNQDPVATTALWWRWHVLSGREGGRPLGPALYDELSYEAFVSAPAERCADLCRFLDVPYDASMLRFNEGRVSEAPGLSANQAWRSPTPGVRNWREQMSDADVELFEALAGDALDAFGHERAFPVVSDEVAARADRFRALWTAG